MKKYIMPAGNYAIGNPADLMDLGEWVDLAYNTADDFLQGPPGVIMSPEDEEPYLHLSTQQLGATEEEFNLTLRSNDTNVPISAFIGTISIVSSDRPLEYEWGSWYCLHFKDDFEVYVKNKVLHIGELTVTLSKEEAQTND